jgi:hypothetical protein
MMNNDDDFFSDDFEFDDENEGMSEDKENYREFPVFKKAMEILYVTRGIVDTIREKDDLFEVRNIMMSNASTIGGKIAAAEGGELFHIKMECAYQIKIAAKELITNARLCEMDNLTDKRYLDLLRGLIDEFRIFFAEWTRNFDPANDIDDGWKIGV